MGHDSRNRLEYRVFAEWLPQSGYQPDGDAVDLATGVVVRDLCTPVRPL